MMGLAVSAAFLMGSTVLAQAPAAPAKPGLTLSSTAFEDTGIIPDKYTSKVQGAVSPGLDWKNVPEGVVSYALIMHDPDAAPQKGSADVLHWLAFNIPGATTSLPEGASGSKMPAGAIEGKNIAGIVGFRGPGAGAAGPYHHYTFELYALDTTLSLGADATRDDVLKAMNGHVLAKGVTVGRFHR